MPEDIRITPWIDDPLYLKLLKEGDDRSRDVLFDEYDDGHDCFCRGKVVRSWYRNKTGVRQITPEERKIFRLKMRGRSIYPFTVVSFYITPDRRHVIFGFRDATRAGRGWRYIVEKKGRGCVLRLDPNAGAWIS